METSIHNISEIKEEVTVCPLCQREILVITYEAHLLIHDRAEMLADILALSRR